MASNLKHDLRAVTRQFQIPGDFVSAEPYGTGHINDTYCAVFDHAGTRVRHIVQRINQQVFKNPAAMMENVQRVTAHIGKRIADRPDPLRRVLTLLPANDGRPFHVDGDGNHWRAYIFIEKARTFEAVESPRQAFAAAKAFGQFQKLLADLPAPRLHDTIPDFHHTPKRLAALEMASEADVANRAKISKA